MRPRRGCLALAKRERPKLAESATPYFVGEKPGIKFIPSGCTILDCALGGGWAIGRVANVVGDKSTAKTALSTEAMANFLDQYPTGIAAYRDTEAAFDLSYANAMGIPVSKIDFGDDDNPILTVEDFAKDFDKFLEARLKDETPGIYVLDSLDALSDDAEMEQDFGKASYGLAKSKGLSTFFRKTARKIERSNVLLLVVSQVRDNIGVTFGEKFRRSGGKALDFYSSQTLWLAHIKQISKTINKVERPVAVLIKAKVKKNKVGLPFREAQFLFKFGYGVEDLGASINWLTDVGRLKDINLNPTEAKDYLASIETMQDAEYRQELANTSKVVKQVWAEIETSFLPTRRKYA